MLNKWGYFCLIFDIIKCIIEEIDKEKSKFHYRLKWFIIHQLILLSIKKKMVMISFQNWIQYFNRLYFMDPHKWKTSDVGEKIIGIRRMNIHHKNDLIKINLYILKYPQNLLKIKPLNFLEKIIIWTMMKFNQLLIG